jgi:SAM-dependent methyltransferase
LAQRGVWSRTFGHRHAIQWGGIDASLWIQSHAILYLIIMMNPAEFANIAAAEARFWWYRGMQAILLRLLDPIARARKFNRVIEAGCGTGYLAKVLAAQYGWNVVPVDLGWEGLQYARELEVPQPVQADIAALPFADSSFDLLLSMDVVVHFPRGQEDRPFAEFSRVLEKGGLAIIRVSALDALRSRHSEFAHERQRFTKRRLVELATRHGFKVHRCTYANSLLFPIALAKFRIWEPMTAQAPASGVQPVSPMLDQILYLPLGMEAAILGAGLNLPIGQSLILIAEKAN